VAKLLAVCDPAGGPCIGWRGSSRMPVLIGHSPVLPWPWTSWSQAKRPPIGCGDQKNQAQQLGPVLDGGHLSPWRGPASQQADWPWPFRPQRPLIPARQPCGDPGPAPRAGFTMSAF